MSDEYFGWDLGADGVLLLTMDAPGRSANTMNAAFLSAFAQLLDRLEAEQDTYRGVVVTSAKKTFFAGSDLGELIALRPADAAAAMTSNLALKRNLRRLETLGRPVAAAINGAALGAGLEIALACHHRVALDAAGTRIGLPEVTLGLLPGGGGVVRTVRLLGVTDALTNVLLHGQRHNPATALGHGLVDELADSPAQVLTAARAWVLAHPHAAQPWDTAGYRMPGGSPSSPALAAQLPVFPAALRQRLKGAPYPAPRAIMAAAVESARVDIDSAMLVEARYFVEVATGQIAKNMTQAFFFDMQQIGSGASRPPGYAPWRAERVAVLGAGMMGAGIAYVCALAGIEVVLKDITIEAAARGKAYSAGLLDKAVTRGRTTREAADTVLARIRPTSDAADTAGADLVIEAVFESPKLKAKVFGEIEELLAPSALLGSNTSTLPITGLAETVHAQENFIGLHFFSPVDRMPLLEIIAGAKTSDAAVARAFDLAQQIGKTPIIINDSRGFFTSRVISRYLDEAMAMIGEGAAPASVEQAGSQAGYPAAPLQLMDELTLTLPRRIQQETKAAVLATGGTWDTHGSEAVLDRMIDEFGRTGRSTGAGFYTYTDDRRTRLWPGLTTAFDTTDTTGTAGTAGTADTTGTTGTTGAAGAAGTAVPFEDMKERMLFAEALEAVRCLDDGVLRSVAEANIGSLLGIGFPAWTGGVLQYINGYEGGIAGFTTRARELHARYGTVFTVPNSLAAKAQRGERYE